MGEIGMITCRRLQTTLNGKLTTERGTVGDWESGAELVLTIVLE